jgi:hypothetical protein
MCVSSRQVNATIEDAETGAISTMSALNLRGPKLTAAEAQNTIDRLCDQGWLANRTANRAASTERRRRSTGGSAAAAASAADSDDDDAASQRAGGGLSLGVRSFIDLKEYLKSAVKPPAAPKIDRVEYESSATPTLEAGEAKIHFSPSQDEEFAILGYIVTCGKRTFRGSSSPVHVRGLPAGTHTFTIKALNVGGSSDASEPSAGCRMDGVPADGGEDQEVEAEQPAAERRKRRSSAAAAAEAAPAKRKRGGRR